MNLNITLKRKVDIQGWHVIGQIAKPRKRKELDPVLLRARENSGTDSEDVAKHLLCSPSREVVARRLLQIGVSFGLLEKKRNKEYVLTDRGENAIDTGNIFVPEYGSWTLWTSNDPLLPSPILRIDEFKEENALKEIRAHREVDRSFDTLPDYLVATLGKQIKPPASRDGEIRIDALEENVEKTKGPLPDLHLHWNVREHQLQLKGFWTPEKSDKEVNAELRPPDISIDSIWNELLAGEKLSQYWNSQQRALEVSFDETDDVERESMSRDLKFKNPSLSDIGKFEPTNIEQVTITPRSQDDARLWAIWRLYSRVGDFATSELYGDWWKEASEPFDKFILRCPTRSALAADAWRIAGERPDTKTWYLVAAEDWNLK